MTKQIALIGGDRPSGTIAAPELESLVGDDARLIAYPSRIGAFPYTPLEMLLLEVGHADAAFTAVSEGCQALVIDSVGDYGLAAMRASLPVPALGAGEAGMSAAASTGRRFAIVTVWPATMNFILEGRLRAYGHSGACTGVFNIGTENDVSRASIPAAYLSRIRDGHRSVLDAASNAIATAVSGGAEAVMLGCTCMSGVAAKLAANAAVPVINPLAAAVAAAERAGPIVAPKVRDGREEMLRAMVEAVATDIAEACPVCIAEPQT